MDVGPNVVLRDGELCVRRMRDEPEEYARIVRWRNQPHVREWWDPDDPAMTHDAAVADLRRHVLGETATRACIIEVGGTPVGFIQFYPWSADQPYLDEVGISVPPGAWGLDIYVGEPEWVSRGVGSRTVGLLADHLVSAEGASTVALVTESANRRAQRAYATVGMTATTEFLDTDTRGGERVVSILMVLVGGGRTALR